MPLLYLTIFLSGMATLAVELSASRLMAPFFGTSAIVFAALIGFALAYLTLGYRLGGWWADRSPHEATLYQIVGWAGFLVGVVPFVARPVLRLSLEGLARFEAGVLLATFLGAALLLSPPIVLLGTVNPFGIRLATRHVAEAGRKAGLVLALTTLGSILGAFLPTLILIPTLGTVRTFVLFALVLLGLAVAGLLERVPRLAGLFVLQALLVALLVLVFPTGNIKAGPHTLFETESAYNYIRVIEVEGVRYLELNEGGVIHSVYDPEQVLTGAVWDYFLVAPYFNPQQRPEEVDSLALIGLAAGTVARQYTEVYGPIPITGVEIDPRIVEVAQRYFAMTEPNLEVVVQDGRYWLETASSRYEVIGIDAYRPPYIPFQLTTVQFFQAVRDHLTEDGVVAINVGRTLSDYRLVEALGTTMAQVFPSVYTIDVPGRGPLGNTLVVATRQETDIGNFLANGIYIRDPRLEAVYYTALNNLSTLQPDGIVFTDDRAPVEDLVHRIMLDFVTGRAPAIP